MYVYISSKVSRPNYKVHNFEEKVDVFDVVDRINLDAEVPL